jgi:hypothetical protein
MLFVFQGGTNVNGRYGHLYWSWDELRKALYELGKTTTSSSTPFRLTGIPIFAQSL